MASLIGLDGPPQIRPAGSSDPFLTLPYAAKRPGLGAEAESRTVWKEMFDGHEKPVGTVKRKRRYTLTYDWLPTAVAQALLIALSAETVEFRPRGASGPTVLCRVTSPLREVEHLTLGYSATIELADVGPHAP